MSCETQRQSRWALFLDKIQKKCSSTEYQNWISPILLQKETEEGIVLEVPNVFVKEYLLDNFKEELKELFPLSPKGEPLVTFLVQETPVTSSYIPIKKVEFPSPLGLQKTYTFENFIEGPSNQFVKSAAFGVASRPGKTYNPLFIHGGVGLGKTHLLHGIGHFIGKHHRKLKIKSITTEGFINDLVDHLKNKSIDKMKRFYRGLDILLVDDIQFLQSRQNFEEEFCNTFESLIHQNKQIVITSDKPPSQLKLSERLTARMEWGLVAQVTPPDLETRVAIIHHKAQQKDLTLTDEIAFFIAEHIYVNVRQLEGAINRLCAYCNLMQVPLTQERVSEILSELFQQGTSQKIDIEQILHCVAKVFEVKVQDIKGDSRLKNIALARQVAMYLSKELLTDSLSKLASFFGGKTHSTLLHAWKKIAEQIQGNTTLKKQIDFVRKTLFT